MIKKNILDTNISIHWFNLIKPYKYTEEKIGFYNSIFYIQPLERGFGITLGNALRRILLSSLQGTAIVAIKINDIDHEYTTIPYVKEDIVQIILNLKSVVIKGNTGYGFSFFYLKVNKYGPVLAGMIKTTNNLEIVNKNLIIFTLTKNFPLNMILVISSGKGYRVADDNKKYCNDRSFIAIDSIFSPIIRCSMQISNSRIGKNTDYDKLSLLVQTDGSIAPNLALALSSKILQDQLKVFINFYNIKDLKKPQKKTIPFNSHLLKKISDLELSVRSHNCLKNDNINYVGDLVVKTESQMIKTPNFGKKSLNEIRNLLKNMGLNFGMVIKNWPPKDINQFISDYTNQNNNFY